MPPDVHDPQRKAFMTELQRIWRGEGVELVWRSDAGQPSAADPHLRIVFLPTLAARTQPPRYGLAEFVRLKDVILVSTSAADRGLAEGLTTQERAWPSHLLQHKRGMVMARAVALFHARELVEPWSDGFKLSGSDDAKLKACGAHRQV